MSIIQYKTVDEIELLRRSNMLVSEAHALIAEYIRPGISGAFLDKLAEEFLRDNSGVPAFKGFGGFPNTLCISIDNQVVHGIPSEKDLSDHSIVSIDCGVELDGYYGDVAFTYIMPLADDSKLSLCRITEESLYRGISEAKVGNRLGAIGHAIQKFSQFEHGYGVVRELVGHGVGRNLHEPPQVPNYGKPRSGIKIKRGLVIAIEPMINMGKKGVMEDSDGWTIVTKDGAPSAHYEHTIAVTENGPDILSDHGIIKEKLKNNANMMQLSVEI